MPTSHTVDAMQLSSHGVSYELSMIEGSEAGANQATPSRKPQELHIDNFDLQQVPQASSAVADPQEVEVTHTETDVAVQELPPVDGGRKAWTFCAAAFTLETMVWGYTYSYGIFQNYYTSHPPFNTESSVAIAAVGTVSIALPYGEALLISFVMGRYPDYVRSLMWFGLGLTAVGLLTSSFATKVWHLILLQGIGVGSGCGLLYFPIIFILPQWFVRRRGLVSGIIFSGSGAGGFLFPYIYNALLNKVGLRWTLRIWAAITFVVGSVALLGVKPRLPTPKFSSQQRRPRFIPPQLHFLKSIQFWAYSITVIFQALSFFPVTLYIAPYTTSVSSPLSATIVLSLFNSSGVVGQILIGYLCDHFPYAWIMCITALGSGLAAFLLWGFADTLTRVLAFAVIFGCLSGGLPSVNPIGSADCSRNKPEQTSVVYGSFLFLKGIAIFVGPIVAGLVYMPNDSSSGGTSHFGSFGFETMEIFVGVCAVATSIGSLVVAVVRHRVQAVVS